MDLNAQGLQAWMQRDASKGSAD